MKKRGGDSRIAADEYGCSLIVFCMVRASALSTLGGLWFSFKHRLFALLIILKSTGFYVLKQDKLKKINAIAFLDEHWLGRPTEPFRPALPVPM